MLAGLSAAVRAYAPWGASCAGCGAIFGAVGGAVLAKTPGDDGRTRFFVDCQRSMRYVVCGAATGAIVGVVAPVWMPVMLAAPSSAMASIDRLVAPK